MRTFLRYFFLALVLLIVALISALAAMSFAIHGREVPVPDMRGKTPNEARLMAEEAGLVVQAESNYYSPTVPEGRVLSQMPAAGTIVRRGWEIRFALSLGPQRITIPQVVGESERVADINIAERGLELGSTSRTELPSLVTADRVVGQNPPADATDISAPRISLLVAGQQAPQSFVMPRFIGQPLGSVTITLQKAGLSVGKVTMTMATPPDNSQPAAETPATTPVPISPPTTSSTSTLPPATSPAAISPASIVVSQDPAPGQKVSTGNAINFVVK
jgi:beta-lactam-binding protein with PASTA domain